MPDPEAPSPDRTLITLFLCGDVMTGRGIDQILPHPDPPELYEDYVKSALDYVRIAEAINGPIGAPVGFDYVWGEALSALRHYAPDFRLINLETSITFNPAPWRKPVNYRMNPANVPCLTAAKVDCCTLANNHAMDWGRTGLADTLKALRDVEIAVVGAGEDLAAAERSAVKEIPGKGRVVVFACGCTSSGIPRDWMAGPSRSGVNLLPDLSTRTMEQTAEKLRAVKRPGDLLVVSIHWGPNWGYDIEPEQITFAHSLIDAADVDILHGHSSHHAKAFEVYKGRLILYGCGDFLNDYEGIADFTEFRDDLALMYLPTVDVADGRLVQLTILPFQIRKFRLWLAKPEDRVWLRETLNRHGARFGTRVELIEGGLQLKPGI